MNILNLTQHKATPDQIAAGVTDTTRPAQLAELLTFDSLPSVDDIDQRASAIAGFVDDEEGSFGAAMIGGAPFLMGALQAALGQCYTVLYAFSVRQSEDVAQPDGTVKKMAVFKHAGFVEAPNLYTATED